MNKIKIIFCGTPTIGAKVLSTLIEMQDVEIELVITQPDRPVGRNKKILPSPVKLVCLENNISFVQPEQISAVYEQIKQINPDLIITCAYGQFIPTKILNIPKIAPINIHGSLLPKYRGGAPIQYSIINGDSKTGITIMKMVKQMDAGDYYVQESLTIEDNDDTGSLFEKLTKLAQQMIKKYLIKIYNNELPLIPQDLEKVTFSNNISSSEERINWDSEIKDIRNLIRGLSPSPIAHTFLNGQRYKIGKLELTREVSNKPPGTIVAISEEGIFVASKDLNGVIKSIQKQGKKMVNAGIYKSNKLHDIKVGDRFE